MRNLIVHFICICIFATAAFAQSPKNPLDKNAGKINPLDRAPKPAQNDAPELLRLKLHEFRDVSMGGVVAYTAITPEGWTSDGKIEWSQGELSFPQQRIEIVSPGGGRVRFLPRYDAMYTEMNPMPGLDPMPPQGTPAPDDFPRWLIETLPKVNPKISNTKLISASRDEKMEAMLDKMDASMGGAIRGTQREVYAITFEHDEAGIRRREQDVLVYTRFDPIVNQNLRSQMWNFYGITVLSAPVDRFDEELPMLKQVSGTVRTTPQWWTQSQALIAELSRIRIEERWGAIRRRGQQIDKMSDDDYHRYKQNNKSSDIAQHDRINTIYETEDFRDTSGAIVNLPIHYQHVYSDGKGNYVLSNTTQAKPGESWNEIDRMK